MFIVNSIVKINSMNIIDFYITDDGSVGLYSEEVHDIYHSKSGALKESFDKFIFPTHFQDFCNKNNDIKLLDICYGIGYNTKSAISSFLNSDTKNKLIINALELSKETAFLSPFINDGINCPELNLYLLANFIFYFKNDFLHFANDFLLENLSKDTSIFSPIICSVFMHYLSTGYKYKSLEDVYSFLHNIYYQNISKSMKQDSKVNRLANIKINYFFADARTSIRDLQDKHDFIFHDGFTPHKQPLLWTFDFLKLMKNLIKEDGIFSTYSNSTPVRSALSELGFYLGKILIDGKQFGTIASLSKDKIENPLNDYEYGILKTKSGIPYRDENLNLSTKEILINRDIIVNQSDKISLSAYKKGHENE